jgi:hypothetical protein
MAIVIEFVPEKFRKQSGKCPFRRISAGTIIRFPAREKKPA